MVNSGRKEHSSSFALSLDETVGSWYVSESPLDNEENETLSEAPGGLCKASLGCHRNSPKKEAFPEVVPIRIMIKIRKSKNR